MEWGAAMTKSDIAQRIQDNLEIGNKNVAAALLESVLDIMKATLESGEDIKISGFGNFSLKSKAARRGRNPQTGEDMTITPRRILRFKASQRLVARINDTDAPPHVTAPKASPPRPAQLGTHRDWRKRTSLHDMQEG